MIETAGRADQRARLLRRKRVADPDRNVRPTAGAIVCGWITFAPKYASSIASLYESESMTWRIGHAARIGGQHAVDVGPDHDLLGIQQRAEDRAGEVAAVPPERGLQAGAVAGDEAGDDERRGAGPAIVIATARVEIPHWIEAQAAPTPPRRSARASIHPVLRACRAVEDSAQNKRVRPDLAIPRNEVAHVVAGGSASAAWCAGRLRDRRRRDRTGARKSSASPRATSAPRDGGVPARAPPPLRAPGDVLFLREQHQPKQRVGDAAAGRQHHRDALPGCDSMILATRAKQSASATLEPPNLWTTQELGSRELMAWALLTGKTAAL